MIKVYTDKKHYKSGQDQIIYLLLDEDFPLLDQVSINFYRITNTRNEFTYGSGRKVERVESLKYNVKIKIPQIPSGYYYISNLSLLDQTGNKINQFSVHRHFQESFFYISEVAEEKTDEEIIKDVKKLIDGQNAFNNHAIYSKDIDPNQEHLSFNVLVFCIGSLVHTTQYLKGYRIVPLKNQFDYKDFYHVVNNYTRKHYNLEIPYVQKVRDDFNRDKPIYVIEFQNIVANDARQAALAAVVKTEMINTALAFQRRQRASIFSYVTIRLIDGELQYQQAFTSFPGYSGNLVSDFSNTGIAKRIEKYLPVIENNDWGQFLLSNYATAMNETNVISQIFYLWTILDLLANKNIPNNSTPIFKSDGTPIKRKGQQITTKGIHGKAYLLLQNSNFPEMILNNSIDSKYRLIFETNKPIQPKAGDLFISLWDFIECTNRIRNIIAHQGVFSFSRLNKGSHVDRLLLNKHNNIVIPMLRERLNEFIVVLINKDLGV